jgi:hypothetical protein
MRLCRLVDILDRLIPLDAWRGWLVGGHRERCPRCQALLASREDVRRLLVKPEDVAFGSSLWPALRREIARKTSSGRDGLAAPRLVWKRAAVGAAAGLLAVLGLWMLRSGISVRTESAAAAAGEAGGFKLSYIRVGGEPATAYIYQPQDADFVVVWAERNP